MSPQPSPDISPPASHKEDKPQEQAAAYVDESTEEDVTLPPMPEPTEGDIFVVYFGTKSVYSYSAV